MQKRSWLPLAGLIGLVLVVSAATASAQPIPAAAPSKAGTRFITLGTRSGPQPTVGRAQSSNVLIVNGALYIVDAGDGVTRRLTKAGIAIRDIDNIFITHPHSDHTSGLAALLTAQYDLNRTKPVNIYGPPGIEAIFQPLLAYLTVNAEIRISDGTRTARPAQMFFGHGLGIGTVFQDGNVKVTAAENSHFNFPPGSPGFGKYKSYSYRFETADRIIVFTGDTGPSDALVELAKGADTLVSEVTSVEEAQEQRMKAGVWQTMSPAEQTGYLRHMRQEHITPDEVGNMATRAGVKTVVLTHLPATADPKDEYKRYGEQVKKQFSGQVLIAKDLMEF
jgi:ribonuclease BN (tRNA processing enzyme)